MKFYENVCNEELYNRAYLFLYIVGYVCFMKASDGLLLPYLTSDNINYPIMNNFLSDNILLILPNI